MAIIPSCPHECQSSTEYPSALPLGNDCVLAEGASNRRRREPVPSSTSSSNSNSNSNIRLLPPAQAILRRETFPTSNQTVGELVAIEFLGNIACWLKGRRRRRRAGASVLHGVSCSISICKTTGDGEGEIRQEGHWLPLHLRPHLLLLPWITAIPSQ